MSELGEAGSIERGRGVLRAVVATAAIVSLTFGGALAANADTALPPVGAGVQPDPLTVVSESGLLLDEAAVASANLAVPLTGMMPATPNARPVTITPLVDAPSRTDAETGALVHTSDDYGVVTGVGASGTNASFIVLQNADAPTEYRFQIDSGTTMQLNDDGSATVFDEGHAVNYFSAPWAVDANGIDLPTHYSVEGDVLVQHIDTTGAAFPVVADPTSECGIGWCSVYFNRTETKAIADGTAIGGAYIVAGCALVNPIVGAVCTVGVGVLAGTATTFYNDGNCLGINFSPVFGWVPFSEPRGTAHCR
jgi:hypothetical protein